MCDRGPFGVPGRMPARACGHANAGWAGSWGPRPPGGTRLRPGRSALVVRHGAARVGVQDAPADQLLREHGRRLVVDHGEGPQVVLADRAPCRCSRRAGSGSSPRNAAAVRPSPAARGRGARGRGPASAAARRHRRGSCRAGAPAPGRRRSRPARQGAARSRRGRRARRNRPRRPSSGPATSPPRRGGEALLGADGAELGPELLCVFAGHKAPRTLEHSAAGPRGW